MTCLMNVLTCLQKLQKNNLWMTSYKVKIKDQEREEDVKEWEYRRIQDETQMMWADRRIKPKGVKSASSVIDWITRVKSASSVIDWITSDWITVDWTRYSDTLPWSVTSESQSKRKWISRWRDRDGNKWRRSKRKSARGAKNNNQQDGAKVKP
jgi:hypothetical protein